ncbi:hypothetical protein V474_07905 [Novosphingobium barchaimii LL02]|uniref:Uncharacterized protein n=1 Tax=Novosphingobium barchaimii LL02 TaxID=1114963 RepID=A0A0J7Y866_9SPHN|nr:hypothetical protein [Novosphingobium barchaimii]KMS60001.1 hypothetical protein V474_07905 [Novosphingobium barchaimii LL02]
MTGLAQQARVLDAAVADASLPAFAQSQADFDFAMWKDALDRLDATRGDFRDAIGLLSQFLTAMRMEGASGPLTNYAWRRTETAMRDWGLETAQ